MKIVKDAPTLEGEGSGVALGRPARVVGAGVAALYQSEPGYCSDAAMFSETYVVSACGDRAVSRDQRAEVGIQPRVNTVSYERDNLSRPRREANNPCPIRASPSCQINDLLSSHVKVDHRIYGLARTLIVRGNCL